MQPSQDLVDLFMDGTQVVPPVASGRSTVVQHLPNPPRVEGSNPAPAIWQQAISNW